MSPAIVSCSGPYFHSLTLHHYLQYLDVTDHLDPEAILYEAILYAAFPPPDVVTMEADGVPPTRPLYHGEVSVARLEFLEAEIIRPNMPRGTQPISGGVALMTSKSGVCLIIVHLSSRSCIPFFSSVVCETH
jgi:hypothetical protein